ncbi:MAG TPA: nuclear transport factor 2 family protein [Fontimonas sp.]
MRKLSISIAGLALLLGPALARAQDGLAAAATVNATATPEASAAPADAAAATPTPDPGAAVMAVVIDFHRAIEEGYREGAVRLLDENLIVFESGFVEASRAEYAAAHLGADLQYAMTVKREVIHTQTMVSGNVAVALSQTRSKGEFAGAKINLTNTETMVLRLGPDGWKIAHIHWSGHELKDVPPAQ